MLAPVITAPIVRPVRAFCVNGHEMSLSNTLWQRVRGKYHRRLVYPVCRICKLAGKRQYDQRQRENR
jgi:hypothetical protein